MASIIRLCCYLSSHDSRSHNKYGCSITSPHSRANTNDRILKALGATNWSIRKYFYTIPFTLFAEVIFWESNWYFIIVSSAAIWNNSTSRELLCQSSTSVSKLGIHPLLNVANSAVCFLAL
jgi:hypothetical protein